MGIPLDKALWYFLGRDFIGGFRLGMRYFFKPKATLNYPHEKGPVSYTHLTLPTIYSV